MKRRQFIQSIIPAGVLAGGLLNLNALPGTPVNNIIVKNSASRFRFQQGIEELGGIKRFVKKGDRVVIKPVMAFDKPPVAGFNSDPELIGEIITQCRDADARGVSVFDHTIDSWTKCYKNSGIERIAKDAFARVLPANDERFYSLVESAESVKTFPAVKMHNAIVEADVFINVATVLPGQSKYLGAVANLSGCIWERDSISRSLAELLFYLSPQLTILDSKGANSEKTDAFQVISDNSVAADLIALQLLEGHFKIPGYIKDAINLGYVEKMPQLFDIQEIDLM